MVLNRGRLPADIALAANRIRSYVRETPVEYSPYFSEVSGASVWLKLENLQLTGSFKLRGATNKLLSLSADQKAKGCVAASSGNHGAAVAHAMRELSINGLVFVPEQTSSTKIASIRRAGIEARLHGTDGLDTEMYARRYAAEHGMEYLSPYNDIDVVIGQGTCGVEISRQVPDVDAVFVAVGGGGLIGGIAAFLKAVRPGIRMVSCQPAASAVMTESIREGRILDLPSKQTLSDGTAGGIEEDSITFELCREMIDDFVLVSEEEIADAMRSFIDAHHMLLEGSAGVALAGLIAARERYAGKKVVVVICGANISRDTLKRIL